MRRGADVPEPSAPEPAEPTPRPDERTGGRTGSLREDGKFVEGAGVTTTGDEMSAGTSARSTKALVDFMSQPARTVTVTTGSSTAVLDRTRMRGLPGLDPGSSVTLTPRSAMIVSPWATSAPRQSDSPPDSDASKDRGMTMSSGLPIHTAPWGRPIVKADA
jgi:hypothetical protein